MTDETGSAQGTLLSDGKADAGPASAPATTSEELPNERISGGESTLYPDVPRDPGEGRHKSFSGVESRDQRPAPPTDLSLPPAEIRRNLSALDTAAGPDLLTLAETLYRSSYFTDIKSASQAVVKILYGRELGIGAVSSMANIHVVQGKPAMSAALMLALACRAGYRYEVVSLTDQECQLDFYDRDGEQVGTSTYSMKDAARAKLENKDNWKMHPRNMLFSRAAANGCRWFCASALGGVVYTPEELADVRHGGKS